MNGGHDDEDVRAALLGDHRAFERIVARWQVSLVRLAYRYTRDRQLAEDLAQDAFLLAWRKLGTWRGSSPFRHWILRLASNLYTSKARVLPRVHMELPDDLGVRVAGVQDHRAVELHRAVSVLPEPYRETVVLFYFNERNLKETATLLQCPSGTVKARLSRARSLLEDTLRTTLEASDR